MFFGNSCRRSNLTSPKIGRSGKGKKTLPSDQSPLVRGSEPSGVTTGHDPMVGMHVIILSLF
jgi:hypothetical protein